ncbi:MAG: hypothetical protein PHU06_08595 [Gallionella sp.]|nr:hypothetical protein [Gallionella sp.]
MPNTVDLAKQRDLVFAAEPECQVLQAFLLLDALPNCTVQRSDKPNTLVVSYHLQHHTLESLEKILLAQGFVLDDGFLHRIARQVIYYCEDTCCHNMDIPEHHTKKNEQEVFAEVYNHHLHGDRDDTPPELRKYK